MENFFGFTWGYSSINNIYSNGINLASYSLNGVTFDDQNQIIFTLLTSCMRREYYVANWMAILSRYKIRCFLVRGKNKFEIIIIKKIPIGMNCHIKVNVLKQTI